MSLSTELQRLAELRASGALTEAEFERAKEKLLRENPAPQRPAFDHRPDDSLGRAANRYVTFQAVMGVIAILIFLFVFAPKMCSSSGPSFGTPSPFRSR